MVINLDIPWNPAVLEQRIARVYRLGQKNNVQVVNLVSLGTIEHRMLDVLAFKSGLAEGILDGGEDSIFMDDSKFKKFMESVEEIAIVPDHQQDEEEAIPAPVIAVEEIEEKLPADAPRPLPKEDDWKREGNKEPKDKPRAGSSNGTGRQGSMGEMIGGTPSEGSPQALMQMGMQFLSGLAQTLADPKATQDLVESITETDKETGETYVKIPVQGKDLVQNAFKALGAFFQGKGEG